LCDVNVMQNTSSNPSQLKYSLSFFPLNLSCYLYVLKVSFGQVQ